MRSQETHKVCFPIAGVPAIHRNLERLREAGIGKFLVVVGSMAQRVMECISKKYADVMYAFQPEPLGTGDAALKGVQLLKAMGISDPTLIVMGDKIIAANAVRRIVAAGSEGNADVVLAVQPKEHNPSGGRIVYDEKGRMRGIIEERDIHQAIREKSKLQLGSHSFSPEYVEAGEQVNAGVYLFRTERLYRELQLIGSHNAQGEIYLTEAVNNIANDDAAKRPSGVVVVHLREKDDLLTYNTVEELREVEKTLKARTSGSN